MSIHFNSHKPLFQPFNTIFYQLLGPKLQPWRSNWAACLLAYLWFCSFTRQGNLNKTRKLSDINIRRIVSCSFDSGFKNGRRNLFNRYCHPLCWRPQCHFHIRIRSGIMASCSEFGLRDWRRRVCTLYYNKPVFLVAPVVFTWRYCGLAQLDLQCLSKTLQRCTKSEIWFFFGSPLTCNDVPNSGKPEI